MKLSQWHDGSVKPVHVGVYEKQYEEDIKYSFFDGKKWRWSCQYIEDALVEGWISPVQNIKWRGIVKDKK